MAAETARTLRDAAASMKADHGPDHKRHEMWAAMGDLLTVLSWFPSSADPTDLTAALRVAETYMAARDVTTPPAKGAGDE